LLAEKILPSFDEERQPELIFEGTELRVRVRESVVRIQEMFAGKLKVRIFNMRGELV
jgi:hypothetical protein